MDDLAIKVETAQVITEFESSCTGVKNSIRELLRDGLAMERIFEAKDGLERFIREAVRSYIKVD